MNRSEVAKEAEADMYGELWRRHSGTHKKCCVLSDVIHVVSIPPGASVLCDLGQETARELF